MNDFKFGKSIKICGKEYWADPNTKTAQEKIKTISARIKNLNNIKDDTKKADELIGCVKEFIDTVFEGGTFEDIFSNRKIKLQDVISILDYIRTELAV